MMATGYPAGWSEQIKVAKNVSPTSTKVMSVGEGWPLTETEWLLDLALW